MSKKPFFSIIIPTRNRPDLFKLCLFSVLFQSFQDFEIIISDNSDHTYSVKNIDIVNKFNNERIKYFKPKKILDMPDNWEFALNHATGIYQGVLIDKTLLKQNALKVIFEAIEANPCDIINYLNQEASYYPDKFLYKFTKVKDKIFNENEFIVSYNPQEELKRRIQCETNIREEGVNYHLGKICFGFYRDELINDIRKKFERIFYPYSCDYTSCALGLYQARSAMYVNQYLLYSIGNHKGNGYRIGNIPGEMINYLKTVDPFLEKLKDLPIPNLYSSLHNLCAHDYLIIKRLGRDIVHEINKDNLIRRCIEDLLIFPFESELEKQSQLNLLKHSSRSFEFPKEYDFKSRVQKRSFFRRIIDLIKKRVTLKEKFSYIRSTRFYTNERFCTLKSFLK